MSSRSAIPALSVIVTLAGAPAMAQSTAGFIQQYAEQLLVGADTRIGGTFIASAYVIHELYQRRSFQPAWTSAARVNELINLIGRAPEEGLSSEDYNYSELRNMAEAFRENPYNPGLAASFDVLLTDSLARYFHHLALGKIDPGIREQNWNWKRGLDGQDPAVIIQNAIDSDSLEGYIHRTLNRGIVYYRMKEGLAEYRALHARGGWPKIPSGSALRPGVKDERVPVIRRRLMITGDLQGSGESQSRSFDAGLENGVKKFQERHNLEADGIIGPRTLATMNVSVDDRIDQIRVNLERIRWVSRDVEDEFLIVNLAASRVLLVRNGELAWSGRGRVGRYFQQTPVFKSTVTYLQFNPAWTVPPALLSRDVLPRAGRDRRYLGDLNMEVVDSFGKTVDPAGIDFTSYTARNFPYRIVQRPGPANALGRVKFIFPNSHFVFLHGTPRESVFDGAGGSFTAGCIRVGKPFELAELLLYDQIKWDQTAIQTVLDSEEPTTVFLKKPMTVLLLYGTVGAMDEGALHFYEDIYKRDAPILKALNGDFEYSVPEGAPGYLN